MNNDNHLQRHLELCRRIYMRMLADGTWPWKDDADSQNPEDLVESEDTNDSI